MGITIEFKLFGVEIKDIPKGKRVFLNPKAWEHLMQCKHQIDQTLGLQKDGQWKLDEEEGEDLRAHVSIYLGNCYLHIRHWYKDRPTKKGVSMMAQDWVVIKAYMMESPETSLGIKVLKQLLKKKISKLLEENCDGCVNDWPSQTDHECLQDGKAQLYIDKAVSQVSTVRFIASLAEAACEEKLVLQTPDQTFKRIMQFHIKDIKNDVSEEFDF